MEKLIETITFMCGSFGACAMIITFLFILRWVYKFIDSVSNDETKKIVKETIKEVDKSIPCFYNFDYKEKNSKKS